MNQPHHTARKRFGQNFLHDAYIIERIVDAIAPANSDCLVEIGPGLAALTRPLLRRIDHVHAVELDRDLVAYLSQEFTSEALTLHSADALQFDFSRIATDGKPLKVVGNLPYNISSPLLFHLVAFAPIISMQVFMLQKEVIERMVAAPRSKAYGRLSVMLQYHYHMEHLFDVPPHAFTPAPKVTSAIVRMTPKRPTEQHASDLAQLSRLVAQAFGQRRKMLRNTLQDLVTLEQMAECAISPTARAEELSLDDFVRLSNYLYQST